ncbi:MAG TPA: hypothetical protein VIK89_02065 [Cytophagaceae bacterium]
MKLAEKHYQKSSYILAINYYKKALDVNPDLALAKLRIADCYRLLNNTQEAELWYEQVVNNMAIIRPKDKLNYAQILLANGEYEKSKEWFSKYNQEARADSIAIRKIEGIVNLKLFYEDSSTFPYKYLPINTSYSDFSPVYYSDGIVFTSSRTNNNFIKIKNAKDNSAFLDLYYSKLNQYKMPEPPVKFDERINSALHEGPVAFYDNDTKMVFTRNQQNLPSLKGNNRTSTLSLFFAEKNDKGVWSNIHPFTYNSPKYSVAHPTITEDGNKLFFVSNMPGGYGGTDIYVCYRKDSTWGQPINLGPQINTSANEAFPFIFNDSLLYFSSRGYSGLGGYDIYRAIRINDTQFGQVKNMGYPINSSQDDFGIHFYKDGMAGYFSSNRNNGGTDDDIFSFEVVKILVEGKVKEENKDKIINDASIKLYYNNKEIVSKKNNSDGRFYLNLDPEKIYVLEVSRENYKTKTIQISTKNAQKDDIIRLGVIELEKLLKVFVKGTVKTANTVRFDSVTVLYKELGTNIIDTLLLDHRGEFYTEINPESSYEFFAITEDMAGSVSIKPTKRKLGVSIFYASIQLLPYENVTINAVVKATDKIMPYTKVIIKNKLTDKTEELYTNDVGRCRFNVDTYANYVITAIDFMGNQLSREFNFSNGKNKDIELIFNHSEVYEMEKPQP